MSMYYIKLCNKKYLNDNGEPCVTMGVQVNARSESGAILKAKQKEPSLPDVYTIKKY